MTITQLLSKHREVLLKDWTDAIFSSYPLDTKGFLRNNEDRFANPVGAKTRRAVTAMLDAITGQDMPAGEPATALAEFVRIRAIQNFSPEKALGVIFYIKQLLQKHVLQEALAHNLLGDFLDVQSRVDTLSLLAFHYYAEDRERLHMMKVDDYKRRYAQLIRRAQLILEEPEGEPEQSQPKA